MPKYILMIEDDVLRARWVRDLLRKEVPEMEFTNITNEKEFFRRFNEWSTHPPDLVIIDQMIPYTSDEDESEDPQALRLNAFEGGNRCYERLRKDPKTSTRPVVFYTILDRDRVPGEAEYVKKTGDIEQPELIEKIRFLLGSEH